MNCWASKLICVIQAGWHWVEDKIPKRVHRVADVEAYEVTADELASIEKGHSFRQNDLTFFAVSVGVFASFLLTLLTVFSDRNPTTWMSQIYLTITVVSGLASVYFWRRWHLCVREDTYMFKRIRERAIGPLGEEGKEIKQAELDRLPAGVPGQQTKE